MYVKVELLGHELCLHLTLAYNTKYFSKRLYQFVLHQPFMIVPSAPHPQQHVALTVLILAILVGVYYHLFVDLIYLSIMTIKVKYCFKCLQAIFISFETCLFNSFIHFSFGCLSFTEVLYILWIQGFSWCWKYLLPLWFAYLFFCDFW